MRARSFIFLDVDGVLNRYGIGALPGPDLRIEQGRRLQFAKGEVHRHKCPTCYEAKPCTSVCEYEPDCDDDSYDELFGCVAQCGNCRRIFQVARLLRDALARTTRGGIRWPYSSTEQATHRTVDSSEATKPCPR